MAGLDHSAEAEDHDFMSEAEDGWAAGPLGPTTAGPDWLALLVSCDCTVDVDCKRLTEVHAQAEMEMAEALEPLSQSRGIEDNYRQALEHAFWSPVTA